MTARLPAVSAICLTYGRVAILEEAIQSFLLQDYQGPKELLVLNDLASQTLRFDHPDVRVINLPLRFRTVGEKMNAAAALCSHDLLFVWDDDDIYLPHRISLSVQRLAETKGFFTPRLAWHWSDGQIEALAGNTFHSGSCFRRELFDAVQGYAAMGNGYDQEIESRFEEARPGSTAAVPLDPAQVYYLYRWGGTGSYHMSAFGHDRPGQNAEQQIVTDHVAASIAAGAMPTGEIALRPRWRADYVELVRAHRAAQALGSA
jgi:hypothetical protein